jgi:heme/copper-type cytochrome/quinol oxidase subunit 4
MLNFLSGKKTYIIAFVLAVVNFAVAVNWISPDNLEQINAVLVALGIGAVRAGISKI